MSISLTAPVFIVGLPRTGSKLLMNIINNNEVADYHIANEVQFFGHSRLGRILQSRRGVMPIIESERNNQGEIAWDRVVDKLFSGAAKGVYWNGLKEGWLNISKETLLQRLQQTDGTPKSVYATILATQGEEHRAYGDKSGPNLYFADRLIDLFPDGRVLHIIRDPRAILASQHKRWLSKLDHTGSGSKAITRIKKIVLGPVILFYILTYWGYAAGLDRRLGKRFPENYMLVQYEDLILNPEDTTKKICEFLAIPWDPKMVAPPKRDSSYIDPSDVKQNVDRGTGMDREGAERWRKHIRPWMKVIANLYGSVFYRTALKRFGYVD